MLFVSMGWATAFYLYEGKWLGSGFTQIWVHNIGNCEWDDIEKYFAPNARRHILEGEINEKGKAVGWHHEQSPP
ncbi:hypothetical protein BBR47_46500 [Brevibacillus brevis NBRC 100599]|uniref:Uncharacterized protein n=1 Tax=Brevibacillus brevis (strain 47 / JCM 6285 / NBRC 100599) TaxID=358681 RepID=C0ZJQ2_BREBN|nr:hypothetical protein BBR47_46500 [Brevibacillus brevis NBRC 100599]